MLDALERQLCDIQGRLFELSAKNGYNSRAFIETFMNSETAAYFDLPYDRLQWAGEEYILDNVLDETAIPKDGEIFPNEVLFWTGYIYRYWHFLTGETSREIYKKADAQVMNETYLGFHTLDNEMAIENLTEIYNSGKEK